MSSSPKLRFITTSGLSMLAAISSVCLAGNESALPDKVIAYKETPERTLYLHAFQPEHFSTNDARPAVVFFFGGAWKTGAPGQFYAHARYFSRRGLVAFAAEYRIRSLDGTTPLESVADAKSAVRWIRSNAAKIGVDARRIVSAGGSAGGHIAACTALIRGLDEDSENAEVSSEPNALLLFNPVLNMVDIATESKLLSTEQRHSVSPIHHVRANLPPTMILHGTEDHTVPFSNSVDFQTAMLAVSNICRVVPFPGRDHGFFNNQKWSDDVRDKDFHRAMLRAEAFLIEHGLLTVESEPQP